MPGRPESSRRTARRRRAPSASARTTRPFRCADVPGAWRPMRETIVVAGSVAQRPGKGGHAWVFLQYLLGFRRLGYEVLFLDRLDPEMCRDSQGRPCVAE